MIIGNKSVEQIIITKDDEVIAVIADDKIIEKDGVSVAITKIA